MTHTKLAWEFADVFAELDINEVNEVLAKNVPFENLEFFRSYAESFGRAEHVGDGTMNRLPNLMLVGYLLRVLEERLLDEDPS